jgi:hypothetical protein
MSLGIHWVNNPLSSGGKLRARLEVNLAFNDSQGASTRPGLVDPGALQVTPRFEMGGR